MSSWAVRLAGLGVFLGLSPNLQSLLGAMRLRSPWGYGLSCAYIIMGLLLPVVGRGVSGISLWQWGMAEHQGLAPRTMG